MLFTAEVSVQILIMRLWCKDIKGLWILEPISNVFKSETLRVADTDYFHKLVFLVLNILGSNPYSPTKHPGPLSHLSTLRAAAGGIAAATRSYGKLSGGGLPEKFILTPKLYRRELFTQTVYTARTDTPSADNPEQEGDRRRSDQTSQTDRWCVQVLAKLQGYKNNTVAILYSKLSQYKHKKHLAVNIYPLFL